MKRILIACLLFPLLAGCSVNEGQEKHSESSYNPIKESPIVEICTHGNNTEWTTYLRDTITDNVYIQRSTHYGYSGGTSVCPYYDAEGNIMKYSEFIQHHNCGEVE